MSVTCPKRLVVGKNHGLAAGVTGRKGARLLPWRVTFGLSLLLVPSTWYVLCILCTGGFSPLPMPRYLDLALAFGGFYFSWFIVLHRTPPHPCMHRGEDNGGEIPGKRKEQKHKNKGRRPSARRQGCRLAMPRSCSTYVHLKGYTKCRVGLYLSCLKCCRCRGGCPEVSSYAKPAQRQAF